MEEPIRRMNARVPDAHSNCIASREPPKATIQSTTLLYIIRGPVVVIAVLVSLTYPYIYEFFTVQMLVHFIIAGIGVAWMCRDALKLAESTTRHVLNLCLDEVVLDDWMRAIYHPTEGLWACLVGTYVGASSMYGLEMNEEERAELIQSSLFLNDKHVARTVLMKPGGCKKLLPNGVQLWLMQEPSQEVSHTTATVGSRSFEASPDSLNSTSESDKSASDCDLADISYQDENIGDESSHVMERALEDLGESNCGCMPDYNREEFEFEDDEHEEFGRSSKSRSRTPNQSQSSRFTTNYRGFQSADEQQDPVVVFFRILRNMALQRIRAYANRLDRTQVENIGALAAAALGVQLVLRRSAFKKSPLLCAGITTLSLGTVLSREAILGNVYNKESLRRVSKDIASGMLKRLKTISPSKRSFLGMVAFLLFSTRRKKATPNLSTSR